MMDMVLVEWVDSRGVSPEWRLVENMDAGLCLVSSLGFKAKETDEYVLIIPHFIDEGENTAQAVGEMYIPKAAIKRLVFLNED